MKKRVLMAFMRLMCTLIDYLLLLLPTQFILLGVIGVDESSADFLFRLLFAVYGFFMIISFRGCTIGKYLGRLMVVDRTGGKAVTMYVGLRELVRSMYMIPVVGWACCVVSLILLFLRGDTLHDMVGRTRVIYRWQYEGDTE